MTRNRLGRTIDLFDDPLEVESEPESLGPEAVVLGGFALPRAPSLLQALQEVVTFRKAT